MAYYSFLKIYFHKNERAILVSCPRRLMGTKVTHAKNKTQSKTKMALVGRNFPVFARLFGGCLRKNVTMNALRKTLKLKKSGL